MYGCLQFVKLYFHAESILFFAIYSKATPQYNTLHYTTLHYTTLHYIAPHFTKLYSHKNLIFHLPSSLPNKRIFLLFRILDDEIVEEGDVESLFPATVSADGTIVVNKKKIKLKKDCGLYKEEPHLSLRLGKYCSLQYVTK